MDRISRFACAFKNKKDKRTKAKVTLGLEVKLVRSFVETKSYVMISLVETKERTNVRLQFKTGDWLAFSHSN